MPAQIITYRMPNGAPGAVTRLENSKIEAGFLDANTRAAVCVQLNPATGNFQPLSAIANLYGILTRSYPEMTANDTSFPLYNDPTQGEAFVAPVMMSNRSVGIMRSGYMTVPYQGSAPVVKGQPVYTTITSSGTAPNIVPAGAFVDSGFTGAVAMDATYNGPALPNEVVEIVYNI